MCPQHLNQLEFDGDFSYISINNKSIKKSLHQCKIVNLVTWKICVSIRSFSPWLNLFFVKPYRFKNDYYMRPVVSCTIDSASGPFLIIRVVNTLVARFFQNNRQLCIVHINEYNTLNSLNKRTKRNHIGISCEVDRTFLIYIFPSINMEIIDIFSPSVSIL